MLQLAEHQDINQIITECAKPLAGKMPALRNARYIGVYLLELDQDCAIAGRDSKQYRL